jgi:hypothetical protein
VAVAIPLVSPVQLATSPWQMYQPDLAHTGRSQCSALPPTRYAEVGIPAERRLKCSPAIGLDGTIYVESIENLDCGKADGTLKRKLVTRFAGEGFTSTVSGPAGRFTSVCESWSALVNVCDLNETTLFLIYRGGVSTSVRHWVQLRLRNNGPHVERARDPFSISHCFPAVKRKSSSTAVRMKDRLPPPI